MVVGHTHEPSQGPPVLQRGLQVLVTAAVSHSWLPGQAHVVLHVVPVQNACSGRRAGD